MSDQKAYFNALASGIDDALNGPGGPKKVAFCLFVAEFGKIDGGRVNFVSNGDRADMIAMVKEWLARTEGRYQEDTGGRQ